MHGMRKRYPAAAPEAILVDGRVTIQRAVYTESGARLRRDWISWAPVSVSTVLCKRGRVHATRDWQKTLCGEVLGWVGEVDLVAATNAKIKRAIRLMQTGKTPEQAVDIVSAMDAGPRFAAGWTAAPGTWCGTGVVRCQHCEKSLARVMGEPATRRR